MEFNDYNSQRDKLVLLEYGRHIQNMVKSLFNINDKELRTKQAHAVIAVMGNLNTGLRDVVDYRRKLWDHLFIMSDFKLDVDSPYPMPTAESLAYHPEKLEYPRNTIRYKQYGNNIRKVIDHIKELDSQDDRDYVATNVAKFMKVKSYEYNQEYPSNDTIINDIKRFSGDIISLDDKTLNSTKLAYRNHANNTQKSNTNQNQKKKQQQQRYKNNKRK